MREKIELLLQKGKETAAKLWTKAKAAFKSLLVKWRALPTWLQYGIPAAAVALILCIVLVCVSCSPEPNSPEILQTEPTETETQPQTEGTQPTQPQTEPTELPTEPTEITEPTEPEPTEPEMLPEMAELYEQNPDIVAWVTITGTKLDDPVVYTPEDENKYLYLDIEGNYSKSGTLLMETDCSWDPESQVLIIYGHHMENGTKFGSLLEYRKQAYWEEHPTILLKTLYEEREYEIIAAFYDQVYYKTDTCFKFYQFIDPADEEAFNEGIAYFKKKAKYDTGVTAEYGDSLLMLVTCSYHVENGRFVVVAREITAEE